MEILFPYDKFLHENILPRNHEKAAPYYSSFPRTVWWD